MTTVQNIAGKTPDREGTARIRLDLTPSNLFGNLPVLKLKFTVRFPEDASLPSFLGSAWRGLIGWEMQRLVCPFERKPKCSTCTIKEHCPYFMLMEKRTTLPGILNAPRGYVFYCPESRKTTDIYKIHVTLFGSCVKLFPVLVKAFFNGRKSGLGARRFPYEIVSFEKILPEGGTLPLAFDREEYISMDGPTPLSRWLEQNGSEPLKIRLTTPLRLRKQGKYLGEFDPTFFLASLARRLEALNCLFHDGTPLGKETWERLQESFSAPGKIRPDVRWRDLSRYSNRQHRRVPMGGMLGTLTMVTAASWIGEWWRAASVVHVGKGAAMGLGKVEIIL